MALYCKNCGEWVDQRGPWSEMQPCKCGSKAFSSERPPIRSAGLDPIYPWKLTKDDLDFLRVNRIDPGDIPKN